MINPNLSSILYSAYGKLGDLAEKIADTRKPRESRVYIDQATQIRYYLRALRFRDFLTDDQINQILECLIEISGIQDFPVAPNLPTLAVPSSGTTIIIQGTPGERGEDGGGTDFSSTSVSMDTVVDSFVISDARGARWDYVVYGASGQRAGSVVGGWSDDGVDINWADQSTDDIYGDTSPVEFQVIYVGGEIQLLATVASGVWEIAGSRYFIPNNGSGAGPITNSLEDGKFYIGNASDIAIPQTISGDITISNSGVAAISANSIVNADINSSAAIVVTKLEALTASRGVVTDASGFLTPSTATSAEVGYLSGVTSAIQPQIDAIASAGAITGAITTVVSVDLTPSRVVVSNPAGKVAVSSVTTTELGYVGGVTSAIQTQINTKVTGAGGTLVITKLDIGTWNMDAVPDVFIPYAMAFSKIHTVTGMVIDDAAVNKLPVGYVASGEAQLYFSITPTNIVLSRRVGGTFDNSGFSSTGSSRGYLIITHDA
jgi:hypothetical protein